MASFTGYPRWHACTNTNTHTQHMLLPQKYVNTQEHLENTYSQGYTDRHSHKHARTHAHTQKHTTSWPASIFKGTI